MVATFKQGRQTVNICICEYKYIYIYHTSIYLEHVSFDIVHSGTGHVDLKLPTCLSGGTGHLHKLKKQVQVL